MPAQKLYALNTAHWTFDFSMAVQMTNLGEPYAGTCPIYLIEHPEGTVLFDTGVSYEMKEDPENYGPTGAPHMADFVDAIEMGEEQRPENLLESVGHSPEDVDVVVLSHLHTDHVGNVDAFPNAEFVVQKRELRYAFWPDGVQNLFYLDGDFYHLRKPEFDVTAVTGEYDVFGDGSVVAFPTPGHSPGHQSLRVELPESGTTVLAVDAANHRTGYEQELVASFAWSLEESVDSIREIKSMASATDADVYVHHDPDDFDRFPDPPAALE